MTRLLNSYILGWYYPVKPELSAQIAGTGCFCIAVDDAFEADEPDGCNDIELAVLWAANGQRPQVKHVGVDHCGFDTFVAEQLLHGADIVAGLEQVGGK
jgi:hypothetical protein